MWWMRLIQRKSEKHDDLRTMKTRQQMPKIEPSDAWQTSERKSVATKSMLRDRSASDAEHMTRWLRILFALLQQFRRMRKKTSPLAEGESQETSTRSLILTNAEGMLKKQKKQQQAPWHGKNLSAFLEHGIGVAVQARAIAGEELACEFLVQSCQKWRS